jgi:DNA-binding LacI/PurR family transcriptional regulator
MGSLYKQSRSPYWFADFYLPDGTRRRISTKKTDRAEAELVLATLAGAHEENLLRRPVGSPPAQRKKSERKKRREFDEPREKRPLTLRHLAKAAQVSLSTVSNALRNDRNVAPATRQRVQTLAKELGYRPNPMVSALMASRARMRKASDQLIIAYTNSFAIKNDWKRFPSLVEFFEGARDRAAEFGYLLEEFWLNAPGMTASKMSAIFFHRGIQGILIGPLERQIGHLSFKWDHFAVATIGHSLVKPAIHRAAADYAAAIRLAIRQLRKLGYKRISLFLHVSQDARTNYLWSAGFGEHLLRLKPRDRTEPFFHRDFDVTRFRRWLHKERPDAIISSHTWVLRWMQNEGLRNPDDFGFCLLDHPSRDCPYSGIYQNAKAVGAAALDLVVGQINRNERGLPRLPKKTTVEPVWIPGSSTRPV